MSSTSPFKLLDAYEKGDTARYFGRKREVAQLYNAVFASRLTLLYGASGTGKTSLIRCGLENKFYDTDWLPLFIRRNQDINASLRTVLQDAAEGTETDTAWSPEEGILHLYRQYFKTIYLIFDQFEELFIEGKADEQARFYQDIRDLLQSDRQVKVLLVMREEWLGHLNAFERVVPGLFDNRVRIERMREQMLLRSVIPGMVRAAGITLLEPKHTVPRIIQQIEDPRDGVDLADLQVYLDRMYRRAAADGGSPVQFDPALVEKVGEIKNVLSVFLEEQMQNLENKLKATFALPDASSIPLDILFTLVTNDRTKRSQSLEEILEQMPEKTGVSREIVEYCLRQMQEMRLLNAIL